MRVTNDFFERTILIVYDEAANREILANILADEFKIVMAADGKEALEKIREYGTRLSLVLLDLLMPNISGFDVLK